jgi:hypothetical protein
MECCLCVQPINYPVAVSPQGQHCHLMALCGYLARQLLEQRALRDPKLIDMSRREVAEIIQIELNSREFHYFPYSIGELNKHDPCEESTRLFSVEEQKLAKCLALAFMTRPINQDLQPLTKAKMIEIRDRVLNKKGPENFDDESWLASFGFGGIGMRGVAFTVGFFAIALIAGRQFGRNL